MNLFTQNKKLEVLKYFPCFHSSLDWDMWRQWALILYEENYLTFIPMTMKPPFKYTRPDKAARKIGI